MRFVAGIVTGIVLVFAVVLGVMAGPQTVKVVSHAMNAKATYVKAVADGLEKCRQAEIPKEARACVEQVRLAHLANLAGMWRQQLVVTHMLAEAEGLTDWMAWAYFRAFVLERQVHLWVMADAMKQAGTQAEALSSEILSERKV